MCGVIGLSIGCPGVTSCPLALTRDVLRRPDATQPEEYRSPLRSWYERSSVRQAPRRVLGDPVDGELFFSPDLVPVASHPLVRELPPQHYQQLLVRHLYRYLDFTAKLEHLVVNHTVLGIAHGTIGVRVPEEMRFDALKIYCDEGYHALFSVDLARQVQVRTGIAPLLPERPYFLRRLADIAQPLAPELRSLAALMFVVVSETLISATLTKSPQDGTLVPAVREVIADHALDEGRHHAYFVIFLRYLWAQLDQGLRQAVGLLVPAMIQAFLRPELDSIRAELRGYGLGESDADRVIGEVFAPEIVQVQIRSTASQTIRHFVALDVLGDPGVADEFYAHGLME